MTLEIRRTGQKDYTKYVRMMVAGMPGSGKTLFSSTAPDPIFASTDPRFMSIADQNLPVVDIVSTESLYELRSALNRPEAEREKLLGVPAKTLVFDTVNDYQRIMMRERLRDMNRDTMETEDWVWLGERLPTILLGLTELPMNVIFVVHLAAKSNSDDGAGWLQPALSGQIPAFAASKVDLSVVLLATSNIGVKNSEDTREEDKPTEVRRRLITAPSDRYPFVKDHSGKLPYEFEVNFEDDFQRIYDIVYADIDDIPEVESHNVELPEEERNKGIKTNLLNKAKDRPKSAEEVKEDLTQRKLKVSTDASGKRVLGGSKKKKNAEKVEETSKVSETSETVKIKKDDKVDKVDKKPEESKDIETFEYETEDGTKVSSFNELPDGVKPILKDGKVLYFCIKTGLELPRMAKVEMSRLKFDGKIIHPDYWNASDDEQPF